MEMISDCVGDTRIYLWEPSFKNAKEWGYGRLFEELSGRKDTSLVACVSGIKDPGMLVSFNPVRRLDDVFLHLPKTVHRRLFLPVEEWTDGTVGLAKKSGVESVFFNLPLFLSAEDLTPSEMLYLAENSIFAPTVDFLAEPAEPIKRIEVVLSEVQTQTICYEHRARFPLSVAWESIRQYCLLHKWEFKKRTLGSGIPVERDFGAGADTLFVFDCVSKITNLNQVHQVAGSRGRACFWDGFCTSNHIKTVLPFFGYSLVSGTSLREISTEFAQIADQVPVFPSYREMPVFGYRIDIKSILRDAKRCSAFFDSFVYQTGSAQLLYIRLLWISVELFGDGLAYRFALEQQLEPWIQDCVVALDAAVDYAFSFEVNVPASLIFYSGLCKIILGKHDSVVTSFTDSSISGNAKVLCGSELAFLFLLNGRNEESNALCEIVAETGSDINFACGFMQAFKSGEGGWEKLKSCPWPQGIRHAWPVWIITAFLENEGHPASAEGRIGIPCPDVALARKGASRLQRRAIRVD